MSKADEGPLPPFRVRYVDGPLKGHEETLLEGRLPDRIDVKTKFGEHCVYLADWHNWPDANGCYHVRVSPDTPSIA